MFARATTLIAAVLAAVVLASPAIHAQTHDPRQVWMTFESAHFRVHYYQQLEHAARRVAAIGEGIFDHLGRVVGWSPRQIVEVVLQDNTDEANGSAISVPFNTIRLYVTAPEDLFVHGDYDDWLQGLLVHEYTHIAQTDNISGLPALINAILGKVYPPNAVQPRWIVEGMAVYIESTRTTGGRLQSSQWDALMRMETLSNNLATLDQISNGPNRWPHGHIWYLYGSYMMEYLVQRFGEGFIDRVNDFYGGQLIPFGVNRAIQRATGQTYEQLYPQFLQWLRDRYGRTRDVVTARGVIEGERLTFLSEEQYYPRFLPDGHTLAWQSGDGTTHTQIRTMDLLDRGPGGHPRARDGDWIGGYWGFALHPGAERMIVSDVGFHRGIYPYADLYDRRVRPDGRLTQISQTRFTDGGRTRYPDISSDADHVAYTVNHRGTSSLFEMSLTDRTPHPLFRVHRYEQVYTPRYSPDGRQIVFSQWQSNGFRDVRVIDRESHAIRDLTRDRHLDLQPVFSPDGRYVVWSSDRTGIFNLYAMELSSGSIRQVTNVLGGAFMPEISPDGRTIVYVGYSHRGYDLWRMPFDPTRWIDPGPERTRRGVRIPTPDVQGVVRPYNALQTLYPRTWSGEVSDDGFGPQLALITGGRDVVGNHAWQVRAAIGVTRGDPSFDLVYSYGGLRPNFRVHAYRNVHRTSWLVGTSDLPYPVDRWGGDTEVSIGFPALFMNNTLSFSYEAQYVAPIGELPFGLAVDPNEPPRALPFRGMNAGVRASWSFSRVQRYTYSVSNQEGFEGGVGIHLRDRVLGSSVGSFDLSWGFTAFVPMPWGPARRRHVLALRHAGGVGLADRGPPLFFIGGFQSYTIFDFISNLMSLSAGPGVGLRGYPVQGRAGNAFLMANAEYRFPIWQVDRGISTLPVYLSRLYGGVFMDVGSAWFGRLRSEDIAVGVGAEVLADVVFGYVLPYTFRFGLARGITGEDALWQGYAMFSSPF